MTVRVDQVWYCPLCGKILFSTGLTKFDRSELCECHISSSTMHLISTTTNFEMRVSDSQNSCKKTPVPAVFYDGCKDLEFDL